MKKLLLYGHGGAYNHGAEAILRASLPMFRKMNVPVLLSTHFPEQDREFGLDQLVDRLIPADLSLVPEEKAADSFVGKERAAAQIYRDALEEIDSATVCIGVGGDNYCYPNWHRQSIFHRIAKERGGQSVLWGCSIQAEMIDGQMADVLGGHDHIFSRESLTTGALHKLGIDRVTQLPDPAFLLPIQPVELPECFCGRVAAINLSPLMLRRSEHLFKHFVETAHFLLKKADTLLLLSHVTMPVDNDQDALDALAEHLLPSERARVCRVPYGLNAGQLKYLISRCELLVCCRTHASIAGYSSGIPTLVVGYSVKSQGIGTDLGMTRWVLPMEDSRKLESLTAALWEERASVRTALQERRQEILGQYINGAENIKNFLSH